MVEISGAGASADSCASRIERACATGPSASGTSRSVGTRWSPSCDRKNKVALIFGTAGVGAAPGVTAASVTAATPLGRVNRRLSPVITATPNATAASAMMTMATHCSGVRDFVLIRNFGAGLVFKEFAELDQRVEQRIGDLVLIRGGGELAFLIGVGQIAD